MSVPYRSHEFWTSPDAETAGNAWHIPTSKIDFGELEE